ncbi:hypothetical protein BDK51DRAFT_40102 [Blyttiomyces helicus]|uniref:Uncharacterized protein n=1 Tax=Blyttiomyces helicus TaxID=388810 RepID=A0A4P9W9G6_9FUNG|nr:hypothetical protein BDK51DRAFT_40102 [Blyttiomyces helicus]|eukprot:RKO89044.1 hypothetical protein BDK51DRAFT_40102 [Blyttiomyces helicus]
MSINSPPSTNFFPTIYTIRKFSSTTSSLTTFERIAPVEPCNPMGFGQPGLRRRLTWELHAGEPLTRRRSGPSGSSPASTCACDVSWGDAALNDQFRFGLRDVEDLLLTMPDPATLSEAITQAIQCDNRLYKRCQEKCIQPNSGHQRQPTQSFHPAAFKDNLMQIDAMNFKRLT